MRPDIVAGPIDRKWSRSNSWATGFGALWAASVLAGERKVANDAATAAARAYEGERCLMRDSSDGAEGDFAGAANLALQLGGGETCHVLPRHNEADPSRSLPSRSDSDEGLRMTRKQILPFAQDDNKSNVLV